MATHLDDETFGLGGTLVKLARDNRASIRILSFCSGRNDHDKDLRINSFETIVNQLGVEFKRLDYQDLTLDKQNFQDLVSEIRSEITSFKPSRVFSNCEFDLHRDHQIIAEATKLACRPSKDCPVKELYQYKIPGTAEWSFNNIHFNTAFDISDVIDEKMKLCREYQTELKTENSFLPCSEESILAINKADGSIFGFEYAELARLVFKKV